MRPNQLADALAALSGAHRYRQRTLLDSPQGPRLVIDGREFVSFASNDYLGLANHPRLIEAVQQGVARWGVGGGASHLVAGHFAAHEAAEEALADFVGAEAALLFSSGYAANLGVLTALLDRRATVFADKLNHASLNDACVLSRATFKRFKHNDLEQLAEQLEQSPAGTRLIAVDAVYSMDGDEAPLARLLALAERYDAWLYLDDAHSFGVLGDGRGSLGECPALAGSERVIVMATLGKAAGVAGAAVLGSRRLIDWLVNKARSYIYTTAQPPALACAVMESVALMQAESWRRERLFERVRQCRVMLGAGRFMLGESRTPIQPLLIGSDADALRVAATLRDAGLWVPAIRPPTVPEGSARLRIALSAAHSEADCLKLAEVLQQIE
ncbi:8-amino-7-oxononanoate synthase [Crenobacter sp. SG2305]|uniref:8-amino-7-oxononanoate synthase n=1 Tax=Crenobacter oryzisoli TaxID=3056844 RepID=UPI0025AACC98|nr:8-amino-7-oxononanoate synthase [Crenobacter sp. SG2305]MDN0081244.1 8-amino-7-oxononanoate synthase [Crenobacter sp. SG2305]